MKISLNLPKVERASGYSLSDEQMEQLRNVSAALAKGRKRDWRETGRVIMDVIGSEQKGTKVELAAQDVTGYQEYLLRMGTKFPGVLKGNGPRINGVQTPHHNGDGYMAQRGLLVDGLAEHGIKHGKAGWTKDTKPVWFDITD